jgi:BolA family transcriptional regulator, general stress-responsive regulator
MLIRDKIERKLTAGLAPKRLQVIDDSHHHVGHAGAHPEGESHFTVEIVSEAFEGKPKVARQRLVYDLLADELANRVHALSLVTLTPEEDAKQ